jgi:hypothetical protein
MTVYLLKYNGIWGTGSRAEEIVPPMEGKD